MSFVLIISPAPRSSGRAASDGCREDRRQAGDSSLHSHQQACVD